MIRGNSARAGSESTYHSRARADFPAPQQPRLEL